MSCVKLVHRRARLGGSTLRQSGAPAVRRQGPRAPAPREAQPGAARRAARDLAELPEPHREQPAAAAGGSAHPARPAVQRRPPLVRDRRGRAPRRRSPRGVRRSAVRGARPHRGRRARARRREPASRPARCSRSTAPTKRRARARTTSRRASPTARSYRRRSLPPPERRGHRPHPAPHEPLPRARGRRRGARGEGQAHERRSLSRGWFATSRSELGIQVQIAALGLRARRPPPLRSRAQGAHPLGAAARRAAAPSSSRTRSRSSRTAARSIGSPRIRGSPPTSRARSSRVVARELLRGRRAHALRAVPPGREGGALRHRRARPPVPRRLRAGLPSAHHAASARRRGRALPHDPHRRRGQHLQALQRLGHPLRALQRRVPAVEHLRRVPHAGHDPHPGLAHAGRAHVLLPRADHPEGLRRLPRAAARPGDRPRLPGRARARSWSIRTASTSSNPDTCIPVGVTCRLCERTDASSAPCRRSRCRSASTRTSAASRCTRPSAAEPRLKRSSHSARQKRSASLGYHEGLARKVPRPDDGSRMSSRSSAAKVARWLVTKEKRDEAVALLCAWAANGPERQGRAGAPRRGLPARPRLAARPARLREDGGHRGQGPRARSTRPSPSGRPRRSPSSRSRSLARTSCGRRSASTTT